MGKYLYIKVDTGFVGAVHEDWAELPDEWDTMSEDEQANLKNECEQEVLSSTVETSSQVVEEHGDTPEE